jgi:hypothetical protein
MKKFIISLLLFTCLNVNAQFAIIQSKDGYVYVRETAKLGKNIIQKLSNGSIVMIDELELESSTDWIPVIYNLETQNKNGFIHKSGLKQIQSFQTAKRNELSKSSNQWVLDSYKLTIKIGTFDSKKHQITYKNNFIDKIDAAKFGGTDGEMPKMEYQSLKLSREKTDINLPTNQLFNPNLKLTNMYHDKDTNSLYIIAKNSDGAGSYAVLWIIKDGKFLKRIVILTA